MPVLDAEPACPEPVRASAAAPRRTLTAFRVQFSSIDRTTWDRLAASNPQATPFSAWAFHRAWWDAYGENAHDETLAICDERAPDPGSVAPVAILPLMHRHVVEPDDDETRTKMRHRGVDERPDMEPSAKAIFMGASYHADYATMLVAPEALESAAAAVAEWSAKPASVAGPEPTPWDVIDLRRFRCTDPAVDALADAFEAHAAENAWAVRLEREDVSPVATLPPPPASFDDFLATLGKKERHEVRRKIRRAEAVGPVDFRPSDQPLDDLDAFVDLHQRRWGEDGLFRTGRGGEQSRTFFRRLFELFPAAGPLRMGTLEVAGKQIAIGIWFDDGETISFYNAGTDPEARSLSPGVLLVAGLVRHALELGRSRFDFLRGDEGYKYEWGARDEPIRRLLVERTTAR